MIYYWVPLVVLWYCGACLLDPGLIYYHVKNLSIPTNERWKRPTEGLPLLQKLAEECTSSKSLIFLLLKMS